MKSFFGKVDRDRDGKIASEYPAWMHQTNIRNMEEEYESISRAIERGDIDPGDIPYQRQEADKLKQRVEEIYEGRPDLPAGDKDAVARSRKELQELIRDRLFTTTEMKKGTASAIKEAELMSKPCVKLSGKLAELAEANGIPMNDKGEVSRTQAERLFKMTSAYLEEDGNVESFRRERNTRKMTSGVEQET